VKAADHDAIAPRARSDHRANGSGGIGFLDLDQQIDTGSLRPREHVDKVDRPRLGCFELGRAHLGDMALLRARDRVE